jgi:hypothetical protein
MKKTIITTVGTSILENYDSTEVKALLDLGNKGDIRTDINKIKDKSNSSKGVIGNCP